MSEQSDSNLETNAFNYKDEVIGLIKAHPVLIVNLFALIGGLFNLMYFFKIEYLPMFKMEDAIFLFIVSGFVGFIFTMLIISAMVFPLANFESFKIESLKNITFSEDKEKDIELKKKFFLHPIGLFIFITIISSTNYVPGNNGFSIFLAWIMCSIIGTFFLFMYNLKKVNIELSFDNTYKYLSLIFSSYFFLFFSFLISMSILVNSKDFIEEKFLGSLFLGIFMFSLLLINVTIKKYIEKIFVSITILFSLLIISNTYHVIPFAILKSFNLAQVEIHSIQVDKKACTTLNLEPKEVCELKDLKLLWRSGKNFVLEKKFEYEKVRYIVPINSIIGWTTKEEIVNENTQSKHN